MIQCFSIIKTRMTMLHGSKCNKGNFTFSPYTVNAIKLSSKKKWPPPHFYMNPPPFSGLSPLSSKTFGAPPKVTQFLEGPTPTLL